MPHAVNFIMKLRLVAAGLALAVAVLPGTAEAQNWGS
jgi:hypothetical protein